MLLCLCAVCTCAQPVSLGIYQFPFHVVCLVFAFAPALGLFVFHFLCSVLFCRKSQHVSYFLMGLLRTLPVGFSPTNRFYCSFTPSRCPMYYLCPYVLHFPLCLDIRYLCVHLPHRFAVLLASLRPEENYMFWFLTENCWATTPYGGDTAEQSLIESNCSLELFKQSILMTHSKQSSNFMYSNLFKTDLMKGCPRSSHDTIGQPFVEVIQPVASLKKGCPIQNTSDPPLRSWQHNCFFITIGFMH